MPESDFTYLLDEVLFELHRRDVTDPEQADAVLDQIVSQVARQLRKAGEIARLPSADDAQAVAALAYEQLKGYQA